MTQKTPFWTYILGGLCKIGEQLTNILKATSQLQAEHPT